MLQSFSLYTLTLASCIVSQTHSPHSFYFPFKHITMRFITAIAMLCLSSMVASQTTYFDLCSEQEQQVLLALISMIKYHMTRLTFDVSL